MKNKKRFKKCTLAAIVFSTAINLNGCVYGPPPEFPVETVDEVPLTVTEPSVQDDAASATENFTSDNITSDGDSVK